MGLCDCFNALPRSCVCMSLTCYPRTHATGVTSNTWALLDQSSSSCAVLLTDLKSLFSKGFSKSPGYRFILYRFHVVGNKDIFFP